MREQKCYYVCIMASRSRRLYTGVTGDLFHRALRHKRGEIEGFTKKENANRFVYYEGFKYIDRAEVSIDPKRMERFALDPGHRGDALGLATQILASLNPGRLL